MAISSNTVVQIDSSLIPTSQSANLGFQLRVFTQSSQITSTINNNSPLSLLTFYDYNSVLQYFGVNAEESKVALAYFRQKSKQDGSTPASIQFQRWQKNGSAGILYGSNSLALLADLQAFTSGELKITTNTVTITSITGLDFSADASYSDIATTLQTAIRANAGLAAITVSYNSVSGRFEISTGVVGTSQSIVITAGASNDVGAGLGLLSGTTFTDGQLGMSAIDALTASLELDASCFGIDFTSDAGLLNSDIIAVGQYLATDPHERSYFFGTSKVDDANLSAFVTSVSGIRGFFIMIEKAGEYQRAGLHGSVHNIDYTRRNTSKTIKFEQLLNMTPTVTTTADAVRLENLRVNFFGQYSYFKDFNHISPGKLQGNPDTEIVEMGIYAGHEWLRREMKTRLMTRLVNGAAIPLNDEGVSTVLSVINTVAGLGINNGTIIKNKILTESDKDTIRVFSESSDAYLDLTSDGYYVKATISTSVPNQIDYILLYSGADKVKKIKATHTVVTQN
jgi:hypothetical protein